VDDRIRQITAYLEKKLSDEERRAFEELLNNSDDLRQELKEIRFVLDISGELGRHRRIDTARNWRELSRRIAVNRYRTKILHFARNAAAVLLIPVLTVTSVLHRKISEQDNMPANRIELTSAYGLVTKVKLPDGSDVWLNSGTTISYPQQFKGDTRSVRLSGEAFFDVKADAENRFDVITADGLTVSAYGTEFNVYTYDDEQKVEATLVSGNIEVSAENAPDAVKVSRGQQAVFDRDGGKLTVENVNPAVKTSWKDGKMVFRRASMVEITRRLSRHFNVDIRLEGNELYDYDYSATFTTETLNEILHLLEKSAPITCRIIEPEQSGDYSFTKRTVIIRMNRK
jgi:ferric-dicitrate binding protein FerR (iron transport regulator)